MDYTGCCINLYNQASGSRMHGKCILDNHEAIWLVTLDDLGSKLLWIKKSDDLEITIDAYSEEEYGNLQVSEDWRGLIDLLSQ